eukprot:GHVH01013230.1.p1 GENE.GHVH01013230.1~~GHVH01013230.1.p1  ORF type:complete len:384 (+),score=50.36 GHVH01013230.1:47-1198(+)
MAGPSTRLRAEHRITITPCSGRSGMCPRLRTPPISAMRNSPTMRYSSEGRNESRQGVSKLSADNFVSSISNFFAAPSGSTTANQIEGNLRRDAAGEHSRSILGRVLNLQKYFQITGDEFKIRCTSVFTMIQGIFNPSSGSSHIQGSMFTDNPDLYCVVWMTLLGSLLLGFLPNFCEAIASGRPSQFSDYNSALFIFSLFPLSGIVAYGAGYIEKRRGVSILPEDGSMISLPASICIMGYAEIPVVLAIPILLTNSTMFRLLVMSICIAVSVSYLYVTIRGPSEDFVSIPNPRRIHFMVVSLILLIPYLSILMKLPSLNTAGVSTAKSEGMMLTSEALSQKVEEILAGDSTAVDALAEAVREKIAVESDESEDEKSKTTVTEES